MLELLVQNYDLSDIIHQVIIAILVLIIAVGPVKVKWRTGY